MVKKYQHQLRRRGRKKPTDADCCGYGLAALLFGVLVLVFQPPPTPTITHGTAVTTDRSGGGGGSGADAIPTAAPISIVSCEVSTPHTRRRPGRPGDGDEDGSPIANGRFDIAILDEDVRRAGSSAAAFWELVGGGNGGGGGDGKGFYDGNYVFRAIPGFVVQWGIPNGAGSDTATAAKSRNLPDADRPLTHPGDDGDDPPENESSSSSSVSSSLARKIRVLRRKQNVRGTITMIKGGTGQVFVNTGDNRRLDADGTIPFGIVLDGDDLHQTPPTTSLSGMALIDSIYNGYKGGQGQVKAIRDREIPTKFPEMARIDRCYRAAKP